MSELKAVIKKGVLNEVGNNLDDMLESAKKEVSGHEGGCRALKRASKLIGELIKVVDVDVDNGTIPDLETAKMIKKYLIRSQVVVDTLDRNSENLVISSVGKVQAFTDAVGMTKKLFNLQEVKIRNLMDAAKELDESNPEDKQSRGRAVGTRPQSGIKTRRLAKESKGNGKIPKSSVRKVRTVKGNNSNASDA